nr:hemolysin III family protein [uncultured Rhodopila sp.]
MRTNADLASVRPAERVVDGVVQGVNVVLAVAGCAALAVLAHSLTDPLRAAALVAYGVGLLAMVCCSALYAWGRYGRRRELYRHLDQAAIFLMIAGTYTPFTVAAPDGEYRLRLLAGIWAIGLFGGLFKLLAPRRFEPLAVPLYLIMGWAIVSDPGLILSLLAAVAALLVAGGLLYSAGVVFHLSRLRFQEAIWHGFVLAAAACHYAAIVRAVA